MKFKYLNKKNKKIRIDKKNDRKSVWQKNKRKRKNLN